MANDRMTNDDLDRNMGRAGQDDDLGKQDFGQQTPGRNPDDQHQTGKKGANKPVDEEDDYATGGQGQGGRQGGEKR
jgi:hypothetical protein